MAEEFSASNPEEGSSFPLGSTGRRFQRLVPQTLLKTWVIFEFLTQETRNIDCSYEMICQRIASVSVLDLYDSP